MGDAIEKILASRRQQQAEAAPAEIPNEADKFFSLLLGDVVDDPLLEFRFRDGFKLCLPYRDVVWLSYDPKIPEIKMDFGSTLISITGRGLDGSLFDGLKTKRVAWVKEADTPMQDHGENKVFIEEIGFGADEEEEDKGK